MTWDGVKRGKRYRRCADCGRRFKQWNWAGGNGYGSSYCRSCHMVRCKASHSKPSGQVITCAWCGKDKELTQLQASQRRTGQTPHIYCTRRCRCEAGRKYADKRERAREARRRERAARRARGLTSTGKPITSRNRAYVEGASHRVVPPANRAGDA